MPKFKVMIQGINIPMEDGVYGFYTTRFVQALDAKRAELKVVDQIRNEIRETHSVDSLKSAKASMDLKDIQSVDNFPRRRGRGFCWFDQAEDGSGQSALDLEQEVFWV